MGDTTYYKRNRETAKDYYENNKELLREKARIKYRELSDEESSIGRTRYHNTFEEKSKN